MYSKGSSFCGFLSKDQPWLLRLRTEPVTKQILLALRINANRPLLKATRWMQIGCEASPWSRLSTMSHVSITSVVFFIIVFFLKVFWWITFPEESAAYPPIHLHSEGKKSRPQYGHSRDKSLRILPAFWSAIWEHLGHVTCTGRSLNFLSPLAYDKFWYSKLWKRKV